MKLQAIIIDDEANAREALQNMIQLVSTDVEIIGEAKNVDLGIELINSVKPDLVFLDIQMPGKTGFNLLETFSEINFGVIFTTAYQEFAVKAFRFSAIDYLLKPIDPDELLEAIEKYKKNISKIDNQQLTIFKQHFESPLSSIPSKVRKPNDNQRIALPASEGVHFVALNEIIQCESMGAYTKFHLKTGQKIVVSKVLKIYEEILDNYYFFRVHQSNIINLEHIKRYVKGDGGQVWMIDDSEIEVSRRRKDEFLELLDSFYLKTDNKV